MAAVLGGRTHVEVAKVFGVTRQALGRWIKRYREGGRQALKAKRRGRPQGGSLTLKQQRRIAKLVIDHVPDQLKLPFLLWTRAAAAQLIENKLGRHLSIWTVGRYLKRWGFTPQRPMRRAFEQSPLEVQRWLEEEYPRIREQAVSEKAEIFWGDEMGLRSDHPWGRTYGQRGVTLVVIASGERFRCNMISALTNRGSLFFMIFEKRFKADIFLGFVCRLVRQVKSKVNLIVDHHPVHHSSKVERWLQKHQANLCLFFLPPYSPELNPDEYLNQDVKSNAAGRCQARDKQHMMSNLRQYLRGRQRQPQLVKKYFQAQKVKYAV